MKNSNIMHGEFYKGYSLYSGEKADQGFYTDILDRNINLLEGMLNHHSQVLVVRLDIHFPNDIQAEANNYCVQYYIEEYSRYLRHEGFDPSYLWCLENDGSSNHHYHLYLMLNGNKIRYCKNFSKADAIWAKALRLIKPVEGLVYCPNDNQIMIRRGDSEAINLVLSRLSYIGKVYSKNNNLPCRVRSWGTSRVY